MQQGDGIGAFVSRRPKLPLSGAAAHRIGADSGDRELRSALQELGNACVTYPDPKLFERIHPNRAPITLSVWCQGVTAAANDPRLKSPAWNRFQSRVAGWFETLVMLPAVSFAHEWRDDTVTDSVADVLKQQMIDAMASGNVVVMNECQLAIRHNIFHSERMIAAIEVHKQGVLSSRALTGTRS